MYLDVAVVLLAVLGLVNLALVLAVIRSLRRQTAAPPQFGPPRLPVGQKVPQFSAVTTAGEERALADLLGSRSLMGFFSPTCAPCHAQAAEFTRLAKTLPGGTRQALAVIVGDQDQAADLAPGLAEAASVVIEPRRGPVTSAFSNTGFPTFYLIGPDGRIEASGASVRMVADAVPA